MSAWRDNLNTEKGKLRDVAVYCNMIDACCA